MNKILIAYLAGFFDGEGSIMMTKRYWHNQKTPGISIKIQVSNTKKESIELFNEISIGRIVSQQFGTNNKIIYRYQHESKIKVCHFLKILYPYLLLKREQADILINYCESRLNTGIRQLPYTQHEFDLCARMKILNKRGL